MTEETRRWLEIGALQLAVIVAATHLYWGLPRLLRQPGYSTTVDPRPLVFVLAALVIGAGAIYVALGGRRAPVYALGIALLATLVAGYVWWHLAGHEGALPWVEAQAHHTHDDTGPVETIVDHLLHDRLELVSKAAETALAAVLAALLYAERRE